MKISIHSSLLEKQPELKIGIIHYNKIVVDESPQMINGRFLLFQNNLSLELQETPVNERPIIKEWRKLWKALGSDPNRYRNSAESLMRRVAKQNFLTPIHSAVDLNNLFSLQFDTPMGIYDCTSLEGDIEIILGDEHTSYDALNGRHITLDHILCSRDEVGPFGSPYVDSERTSTSHDTTDALQIFYFLPSFTEEKCNKILQSCGKMFNQIHGGDFEVHLLTQEAATISL